GPPAAGSPGGSPDGATPGSSTSEQLALRPAVARLDRHEPQPAFHLVRAGRRVSGPMIVEVAVDFVHVAQRAHEGGLPGPERVLAVDLHAVVFLDLAPVAEPAQIEERGGHFAHP